MSVLGGGSWIGDRLMSACLAVAPPRPLACRICRSATDRHHVICSTCRRLARRLGLPLTPVTAISLVTGTTALYRALWQYKSGEPDVARRQALALTRLVAAFVDRHLACIAPGGADAVVVVPSLLGRRPAPHPLTSVVAAVPGLPPPVALLTPRVPGSAHGRPGVGGYACDHPAGDRRVLLVDDTYTTGFHLQSAAAALLMAGARSVHPLVVGRYVRTGWPPSAPLLSWAAAHPWALDACVHCRPR